MTNKIKVFIDTAPFIYFIERNENDTHHHAQMRQFFDKCYHTDMTLITSVITLEEYCVFPYRSGQTEYIDLFMSLLRILSIRILDIDETMALKAANIRAEYKYFKSMDAFQLAAAQTAGCDFFLTNDKQLKQFQGLKCLTLDEI